MTPPAISARGRWRRLTLGLPTILGLARRGFFIPYRYADGVADAGKGERYPLLAERLAAATPAFRQTLAAIEALAPDLERIGSEPPPAPRWHQDWFPGLDAAAAYALVRTGRPRRIVEVGSGHSTRFFARAVADGDLNTRIIAIDPAPRAALAGLSVAWIGTTIQAAGVAPFADLAPGDVVSIDSSHILMPGTDVEVVVLDVLPRLPAGVRVQIHDIFLPDAYPPAWSWRGYNEQSAIAALILGGSWRVLWASHFLRTRFSGALAATVIARLPLPEGAHETSLWLEKAQDGSLDTRQHGKRTSPGA